MSTSVNSLPYMRKYLPTLSHHSLLTLLSDKAKKDDQKNLDKLYKDIMNGNLRRRGNVGDAFDMSDSDDEAEQRRRKKQIEFKQMSKALLADERIGKIAQNPKQAAFFNTLADHMEDPEYGFLNMPEEMGGDMDSQSQGQSQIQDNMESQEGNEGTDITISVAPQLPTPTWRANP